jgi:predicted transcriptional regulator YheO
MQKKDALNPLLKPYLPFVSGLAKILGKDCEVLLHDTSIPERSVVACENAHVTGRKIGAPMTAFGRQLIQLEELSDSDGVYNYNAMTEDGRRLKCSVIYIRDKKCRLIGFICVNMDVSRAEQAWQFLDEFLTPDEARADRDSASFLGEKIPVLSKCPPPIQQEKFYRELDDVWAHLLQELRSFISAPLDRASSAELQSVIAKLDEEGFFLLKGSINYLAKELKKSRFTIYGYLRKLRNGNNSDAAPENP